MRKRPSICPIRLFSFSTFFVGFNRFKEPAYPGDGKDNHEETDKDNKRKTNKDEQERADNSEEHIFILGD